MMAGPRPSAEALKSPVIFIADRNGENFRARDKDVLSWCYDEKSDRFNVQFSGRLCEYSYSRERIALYTVEEYYDGSRFVALVKGKHVEFTEASLMEPDIEQAPKIIRIELLNGVIMDHLAKDAAVVLKASTSGLFCYLSKVEQEKARGGDKVERYLAERFEILAKYSLNGRAASVLIDPKTARPASEQDGEAIIYPFGCNLSQMQAVENALTATVSLVEGPPGTGKTQTILNIIANLVVRGKSVLVASPNNSATDNVVEKMVREGLGFVVARLGNTANRKAFLESQPAYPDDMAAWALAEVGLAGLRKAVEEALPKMREAFAVQLQLASDREELRQWELQQEYFMKHFGDVEPLSYRAGVDTVHLLELRNRLAELADSNRGLGLLSKLMSRFVYGIGLWSDFSASPVELELRISRTIFDKEIARLHTAIETAERELAAIDIGRMMEDVTCWSRAILLAELAKRYGARAGRRCDNLTMSDLRGSALRDEYPVVTSTVNAAIGQCGAMRNPFDFIIIDESSQCNLTCGLLAMASAKKAVVVGDTKQLPCVISDRDAMIADAAFDKSLDKRYHYNHESLLSCLEKCAVVAPQGAIPVQLLAEHYRCHPAIIRFCNQRFYGGNLVVMRDERGLSAREALAVVDGEGYDSASDYNRIQAGVALEKGVVPLLEAGVERSDIGIVTPYRKQADGMARDPAFVGIEVDTVHKYQGREKDAMVFVTKVAHTTPFVDNPNLVNVSVSRAKERLVLVVASDLLKGDGNIAELARYIDYQGGSHVQADEPTMFDLLYPSRATEGGRREAETIALDCEVPSEVIVERRLPGLLSANGMSGRVGFVRNYPLKMFVPRGLDLTEREALFVNTRAHADFLFFRVVDMRPLAVLEIDGQQHDTPVQMRRDRLKDSIMDKAGIPLWRLRTNEYKPDKRLESFVESVCKLADSNDSSVCKNVRTEDEGETPV